DGEPTYVSMKATHLADRNDPHIVIGVNNIDAQMKRQLEYDAAKAQNMTYARIAQALSKDYYSIYMVNTENDEYVEYASTSDYQDLHVQQSGKDFFRECRENIMRLVHKEDREMALAVWDKTKLMPELENGKTFSSTYRLMMDGVPVYINCKVIRMEGAEEKKYIVIGVSNVDAQMRRERELNIAREKANRDALTGVKSKHAYDEVILDMNEKIQSGTIEPFAVAVCDVNGLKQINDTKGHQFGDKLIRDASHIICETFKHSPVFRIGGDEFVAIMMHSDYEKREELIRSMAEKNGENKDYGGVIIACGYSDWDPGHDERYEDVFERADASMYVNKESLKN
ncbi:MAG: GGDEF domain-containing protein, partial [Oscillospiraceae bacterium]|nr:GGDEF domain-containing protein [Oscillospiraceae bacterium]